MKAAPARNTRATRLIQTCLREWDGLTTEDRPCGSRASLHRVVAWNVGRSRLGAPTTPSRKSHTPAQRKVAGGKGKVWGPGERGKGTPGPARRQPGAGPGVAQVVSYLGSGSVRSSMGRTGAADAAPSAATTASPPAAPSPPS